MGEKGNSVTGAVAAGTSSLIERVTTSATETVTGVGTDFLETVKDKSVGAVADTTIASAKDRLTRGRTAGESGRPDDPAAAIDGPASTGDENAPS